MDLILDGHINSYPAFTLLSLWALKQHQSMSCPCSLNFSQALQASEVSEPEPLISFPPLTSPLCPTPLQAAHAHSWGRMWPVYCQVLLHGRGWGITGKAKWLEEGKCSWQPIFLHFTWSPISLSREVNFLLLSSTVFYRPPRCLMGVPISFIMQFDWQ